VGGGEDAQYDDQMDMQEELSMYVYRQMDIVG